MRAIATFNECVFSVCSPYLIGIQHDNAPSHFTEDDPQWVNLVQNDPYFRFSLKQQPPNSPDTNVLDLGFFASIQSMQWGQEPQTTIDGLIASVTAAFIRYDPKVLDRIWLVEPPGFYE
jgi:hypothetical protein